MARDYAMLHQAVEPADGEFPLWPPKFPLCSEATAPKGGPDYQACKTGTRFWRAEAAKSVGGEWRVYVTVYGPRGTEHGWTGYSPDEARRAGREILDAAMGRLTEDQPLVQAPWSARVKGDPEFFTLTKAEALNLAFTLHSLAREAEAAAEREELEEWAALAPYDVPGLPDWAVPS